MDDSNNMQINDVKMNHYDLSTKSLGTSGNLLFNSIKNSEKWHFNWLDVKIHKNNIILFFFYHYSVENNLNMI